MALRVASDASNPCVSRRLTADPDPCAWLCLALARHCSLARALYFDAEVYLLDDPLSAVDTRVARILFEQAIRGKLLSGTR